MNDSFTILVLFKQASQAIANSKDNQCSEEAGYGSRHFFIFQSRKYIIRDKRFKNGALLAFCNKTMIRRYSFQTIRPRRRQWRQKECHNQSDDESNENFFSAHIPSVFLPVSYTHLRAHETRHDLVCRL